MSEWTKEIQEALAEPFPPEELKFKPGAVSGNRALALAYLDARAVMDRLDAVVGAGNWSFDYDVLPADRGVALKGKLTVLGATKCDAGEAAEESEPFKSAVSDAFKRCAVHFGVGRFLYSLPAQWVGYDPQKRRLTETPRLGADPASPDPPSRRDRPPANGGMDAKATAKGRVARAFAAAGLKGADARGKASEILDADVQSIDGLTLQQLLRIAQAVERENQEQGAAPAANAYEQGA